MTAHAARLRRRKSPATRRFVLGVAVAFLPAAVAGATLHGFIKTVLFETPRLICIMLVLGGLALLVVVFGVWLVGINNRLVGLDEAMQTQWSQVETVLQRRFDLIPNLVNTVKGYAAHEKEILERVTELRSQWALPELSPRKRRRRDS